MFSKNECVCAPTIHRDLPGGQWSEHAAADIEVWFATISQKRRLNLFAILKGSSSECCYRVFFFTGPAQKSMELVPPNREKWMSLLNMAKISTKKVKVQIRVCHAFTFCCNLGEKIKALQALGHFISGEIWENTIWTSIFTA